MRKKRDKKGRGKREIKMGCRSVLMRGKKGENGMSVLVRGKKSELRRLA